MLTYLLKLYLHGEMKSWKEYSKEYSKEWTKEDWNNFYNNY